MRFNGRIFPIEFGTNTAPTDKHVALTASVFMEDSATRSPSAVIQQLHADFQAYDFKYIPVETLSAVYEQFIDDRKRKGAIYTPEIVADYLLAEVNSAKHLTPTTRVLDPSCGSGIFLVLTYRRLIEQELLRNERDRLEPEVLKTLLNNIYGVERELDACYVAEFRLILTFLHYIEPRELHLNRAFRFPDLHNNQILHGDFFDPLLSIWKNEESFDWIVGNPPGYKLLLTKYMLVHGYPIIKKHSLWVI
jgi:type I restriction-modification system DNA methylase subunit